jgi:thiol-disulfide isomerase/thioredoxin
VIPLFAGLALADPLLLKVGGMDDAAEKVVATLEALDFVDRAGAADGVACATLTGPADEATVRAALEAQGYTLASMELVAACPEAARPKADPWADVAGLDVKVVSRGEEVDLAAVRAPGKLTIVDFGAPWCAPCHTTAATIKAWLKGRSDVALRVVVLDGADAKASFAQPVVKQHLQWAEGLPYFLLLDGKGKVVHKGSDVAALLAAAEKKSRRR